MQSQGAYHTDTNTHTHAFQHTEPGALALAGHCIVGLCGQSLHEWLSSVFLDQVFDGECVFDHQAASRIDAKDGFLFTRALQCARYILVWKTPKIVFGLCWAASLRNKAASSCPRLWETIVGLLQWRNACLGKGCKVMGKESFVSAGSRGSESWADVFIA